VILLNTTSDILRIITSTASTTQYSIRWSDVTSSAATLGESNGSIASATTTTAVAAPASSTSRIVSNFTIYNTSANATQTVVIAFYDGTNERYLYKCSLRPGDTATYDAERGWNCSIRDMMEPRNLSYTDAKITRMKTGSCSVNAFGITAGVQPDPASFAPDPLPDIWLDLHTGFSSPNGRTLDNTITTAPLNTHSRSWLSGMFMNYTTRSDTVAQGSVWGLVDLLVQHYIADDAASSPVSCTAVTLPSRDLSFSGDGVGVLAFYGTHQNNTGPDGDQALSAYVDPVGSTITYTNSAGTGSRTGTLLGFGSSAQANAYYLYTLQAGDRGIRSIQSATWSTTGLTETNTQILLFKPVSYANALDGTASFTTAQSAPAFAWKKLSGAECLTHFSLNPGTTNQAGSYRHNILQLEFTQS
jgi:hypothetical protein